MLSRLAVNAYRRAPLTGLRRPVIQSSFPQQFEHSCSRIAIAILARGAASSVSGRPGSQTPGQAAQNIKEETSHAASDFAKTIAGGNMTSDEVTPEGESFLKLTGAVASTVPQPIMVFGLAGTLPYVGASLTTVYLARQAGLAAAGLSTGIDPGVAITIVDSALNFQVTYGAVMLSFLGALHWGMEFAEFGGRKGYARLALGTAPILYAWPTLTFDPTLALIAQWVGFTALWAADLRATTAGWTPKWYSQYRFYLSILVGTCMIGSLAGISWWGPVAGHGIATHDLDALREERRRHQVEQTGYVAGDIEATAASDDGDYFIVIHKKEEEGEGEGEGDGDSEAAAAGGDDESASGEEGGDKQKDE